MKDKVQKIREEVVRLHNLLPTMDGDNISVNYADRICTTLEMYIDSIEDEPVSEEQVKESLVSKHDDKTCKENGNSLTQEPVSDELDKAAREDAKVVRSDDTEVGYNLDRYSGFISGAEWRLAQMMKKAVDGHATFEFYGIEGKAYGTIAHYPICLDDLGLKDTDKCKMIIIKEG